MVRLFKKRVYGYLKVCKQLKGTARGSLPLAVKVVAAPAERRFCKFVPVVSWAGRGLVGGQKSRFDGDLVMAGTRFYEDFLAYLGISTYSPLKPQREP